MSDFLKIFVPLMAAGLMPVWIPIIGFVVGTINDFFRPETEHPVLAEIARRRTVLQPA